MKIKAVGAYSAKQPLEPMDITRREPGPHDVKIEIAYCGVCHSDIHQVRSEWAGTVYPCVPGHEIVGRVVAVGDQVEKYAPGDLVFVPDVRKRLEKGCEDFPAEVLRQTGEKAELLLHVKGLTPDERDILLDGCLMNYYAKRG